MFCGTNVDKIQFPTKEVNDFEQQVLQIRDEIQAQEVVHEGQSAEEAYASKLDKLSLTEGEVQDGPSVVKALLYRCTLWIEIIREK